MSDKDKLTTAEKVALCDRLIAHLAERGMVVLGPDGEPLNVRPALRACGCEAHKHGDDDSPIGDTPLRWLEIVHGITGPLADACLAAAEVEP